MAIPRVPRNAANAGSIDPEVAAPERPLAPAKRPEIKLTAARQEHRFVGPLPLAIGFIALAGVMSFALRANSTAEDPIFVKARDSLAQYELGREDIERNYDDPVYDEALQSLDKVETGSNSAQAATALAIDIRLKRDAFRQRIKVREEKAVEVEQTVADRERDSLAAHQMSLLMPKKEFPECKEGPGHAH